MAALRLFGQIVINELDPKTAQASVVGLRPIDTPLDTTNAYGMF